ncbi:NAD(P)/FAD-dependent oxidoreductase [Novosphingobium huizhouense]|uniref:NAD(P)/FAD-dependent oxidoreductase n=1 Tax=Novosphingobium huizhouense TaxID=2866625 RepID=UPI001CD8FB4D|nr:FAD-dependent oxidoreductase [Novosphingobium huizhouense]
MAPRIVIVGAGMAGLACADALAAAGAQVTLVDKGRAPGGRMSTRRVETALGEAAFDHGAQYFTARDDRFLSRVAHWAAEGIVSRWPEAGEHAWVARPGMSALPRHIAGKHDVLQGRLVRAMVRKLDGWHIRLEEDTVGPFDQAVVALPAEQAAALLGMCDFTFGRVAASCPSQPCWAGMYVLPEPIAAPPVIRNAGAIGWAARNNAKPGRSGPEAWIVQADTNWSKQFLEREPAEVAPLLLEQFGLAIGASLPEPLHAVAHRWRYARSGNAAKRYLWSPALGLGACGDWLIGPRVENAWLSGDALGAAMIETMRDHRSAPGRASGIGIGVDRASA